MWHLKPFDLIFIYVDQKESLASLTRENSSVGRSYGFDLQKMLISCSFVNTECNSTNFVWAYSHVYGNCFTFNGGVDENNNPAEIQQVRDSGMHNGLKMELYIGYTAQDRSCLQLGKF